jgi:hypothetical protein
VLRSISGITLAIRLHSIGFHDFTVSSPFHSG